MSSREERDAGDLIWSGVVLRSGGDLLEAKQSTLHVHHKSNMDISSRGLDHGDGAVQGTRRELP